MLVRLTIVSILLALVLIAPFALRPEANTGGLTAGDAERLVIITPHNESIQSEFGRAFARKMKREHDREIFVDWRTPGGTSEIARFLQSEYTTRFEALWNKRTGLPFTRDIREGFRDGDLDELAERAIRQGWIDDLTGLRKRPDREKAATARAMFLESEIGIGIDLFFGGGAYDFSRQASAGTLVPSDGSEVYGPAALARERPEWFADDIMPAAVSGEPFRDEQFRWVGTVLSGFGIVYNTDVLDRLGIEEAPSRWDDLADPGLFNQVALADPTKSGSTTKAFEMLIQERIQRIRREESLPEDEAVVRGWNEAMRLILKISANSRYFSDSAAKVPRDVAQGDAAAGMCIDFYGRTLNEMSRDAEGDSHVRFVMPRAGTSIGADPIGLLRGASSPELAHRFIEFVLSPDGQNLWNYKVGAPGGPHRHALRRPPIRRDFYTPEHRPHRTDPEVNPYVIAEGFTYHPEWTDHLFSALRFVMKAACIDPHEEQRAAWERVIEEMDLDSDHISGKPPALIAFENIAPIDYETVSRHIAPTLAEKNKVAEVQLAREISGRFRRHYEAIALGAVP